MTEKKFACFFHFTGSFLSDNITQCPRSEEVIKFKQSLFFSYLSVKTYIVTSHLTVSFLYFLNALKMIHSVLDRKGDNRVN